MKFLNLKAVGDKIITFIINCYNLCFDKIAIHSRIYKELYNRFKIDIKTHNQLEEFKEIIKHSQTTQLLTNLYRTISPSIMEKYDYQVARLTEPHDIIVVSSEIEKDRVKEEMRLSSGAGEVYTIDEINSRFYHLPIHIGIYIFSSVWIKEGSKLVNLLYKINSVAERYKL